VDALEVPRSCEEGDAELACVRLQLAVRVPIQLERLAVLAIRRAERKLVVVRLVVERACVERPVRAFLELDRVRAPFVRGLNQLLRLFDVALMVVSDLRDDKGVAVVTDLEAVDRERSHGLWMVVAWA